MFIIICGAGKVGFSLAQRLADEKNKIILVEQNVERCEKIAGEIPKVIVICGDACEPRYLEEAHAEKADLVVAVTGDDEDNLVICQLAKTYFSVPRTIARANDPRNEYTFKQLGVDISVNSTNVIAQVINQEVTVDDLNTLLKLKAGKLSIVQGKVTDRSKLLGKPLKKIKMPEKCIIVSVLRGEEVIIPRGDTILTENDEVLAVTAPDNQRSFSKLLTGE
jgi:trk system potassium uptake protein TrkA